MKKMKGSQIYLALQLCNHFTAIAEIVTQNNCSIRRENGYERYLPEESDFSLYLKPVTMTKLKEMLASFSNSAAGIDLVPLNAVKYIFSSIQSDFMFLISLCFQKRVFSDCMKCAGLLLYLKVVIGPTLVTMDQWHYFQCFLGLLKKFSVRHSKLFRRLKIVSTKTISNFAKISKRSRLFCFSRQQ